MRRHEVLYRLYDEFDTGALLDRQRFIDLFPPIDSRIALEQWEAVNDELAARKAEISETFDDDGTLASIASRTTRTEAFTALDLHGKYSRAVNVLVLDVDETLRSAGRTDNEIPRETLHLLTELHGDGVAIIICTGQTLENVKGFLVQGLGREVVDSGSVSIVYEGGSGVFTPRHGSNTKQLLYETLDDEIMEAFYAIRTSALTTAPDDVAHRCHLQGNEFNVTLKSNVETGSTQAVEIIEQALVHLVDLVGSVVDGSDAGIAAARRLYGDRDPAIRAVLEERDRFPGEQHDPSTAVTELLERIDIGYYEGDAAEVTSLDLNKVAGVEAALEVLGIDEPFALVMGDSVTDLRVMQWAEEHATGIAAAPKHASREVLDHVIRTDELVYDQGRAGKVLRVVYALNRLADIG